MIPSMESLLPLEKLQRNQILILLDSKTKMCTLFLSRAISSVSKMAIINWLAEMNLKRNSCC